MAKNAVSLYILTETRWSLSLLLTALLTTSTATAFVVPTTTIITAKTPIHHHVILSESRLSDAETSTSPQPPTMAQTYMRGPLEVVPGSGGKALTKEDLEEVKEKLAALKKDFGYWEPARNFMDIPDTKWRYGGPPDYALANYLFLTQRTKQHAPGSLEEIVENLVKTWEMERSHKVDSTQHMSVDQEKFRISANGGHVFDNVSANQVGNYNVLLNSCPANLYDAQNLSWEQSHDKFENAFAAFPWEVLEVFSPPPKVAFSWRHWGTFTGTYENNQGQGELVEMFGFGTAVVNDQLQLQNVEIFYDPTAFLNVLKGEEQVGNVNQNWNAGGCPFHATQLAVKEQANKSKSWFARLRQKFSPSPSVN